MADSIIYLVTGFCYFKDDPLKITREWFLCAFAKESAAWNKVEELRKKEKFRQENFVYPHHYDNPDHIILSDFTVSSIVLFGKN